MATTKPDQEHPLVNILVNVLIPVLVLSYLSTDPALQEATGKTVRPWHLGPHYALGIAVLLPLGYGIWFFIKTKRLNFFSGLGLFSVILTGGLTLYLWNKDGTVKPNADVLFGLKEASVPLVLGLAVILSHWTRTPLLRTFLYTDTLFDIPKIERRVREVNDEESYRRVIFQSTVLFASSFFLSTLMNFGLSLYFLGDLDPTAANARELYNNQVAKITGWGFAVIGVPMMAFLFFTLLRLLKGLRRITGFKDDELMLPR
jgi:hypothetical protein